MSLPPFYITTPLYYVNANPHIGHAYTTIAVDVARRFKSMLGLNTFFTTGTDEHGDKIVRASELNEKSPIEYVNEVSSVFKKLWTELLISNDAFIRTTDTKHIHVVKKILELLYEQGEIYFNEYEGLYCFGCERFYNYRDLVNGLCPDHNTKPELIKESNYFFKMSNYQEWLIKYLREHPDFIRPERYKNEILSFLLKEPLEDLCISRPKSRINWGIELPFDKKYVTYVWFDALINYISVLEYPDGVKYKYYWQGVEHVIAKDILKPHGIYWPIMLKALNIPLFNHLNVHGFWKVNNNKMSKSIGNIVDPFEIINKYGVDQFRYFLMREMVFGLDSTFSEKALINRINSDLANDLGNLFSRVVSMVYKYFGESLPFVENKKLDDKLSINLKNSMKDSIKTFYQVMNQFQFHKGLIVIWDLISQMNKYVDIKAPWLLAKNKSKNELNTVLYNLLEGLRVVAGLLYPIMPETSKKMINSLGISINRDYFNLKELEKWGSFKSDTKLKKNIILFPRIDTLKM